MFNKVGLYSNQVQFQQQKKAITPPFALNLQSKSDAVSIARTPVIASRVSGNELHVVSFTGLQDPAKRLQPALQMRVTGVTNHQKTDDPLKQPMDTNINDLAASNWRDGDKLTFEVTKAKKGSAIQLSHPKFGEIGRVPDEITGHIMDSVKQRPGDFQFELSNIIAGTTKGAATIGLRVNLLYTGKSEESIDAVRKSFSDALNDPEASRKVLLHQPKTSPEEMLELILDKEEKIGGPEAKKEMQDIIKNIVSKIDDPANKRILLVGHDKPDGDTIGCVLGLKNAIGLAHGEDKQLDCAIDDQVTGLFRSKLPGIDNEIKRPYSQKRIDALASAIEKLEKSNDQPGTLQRLKRLHADAVNPELNLEKGKDYDLVIMLDIPAPARFAGGFKNYLENAGDIIYIDHHPYRKEDWEAKADELGVNMEDVRHKGLAWIADRVPAATQLVMALAGKLNGGDTPLNLKEAKDLSKELTGKKLDQLKAYVASVVTGASTDTGSFTRTANLVPEDIKKDGQTVPIQWRPNFLPEGVSKWLMGLTESSINKKWLREEISYDISDKTTAELPVSARDQMLAYAQAGMTEHLDIGTGFTEISYAQLKEVLDNALVTEPETNLLDVQNSFKYSEVMGDLKASAKEGGRNVDAPNANGEKVEIGPYDEDKLAVFVCESGKKGEITDDGKIVKEDSLRFSFRSQEGSIHAELIASLFGGGGHGGAAGAAITGEDLSLDTPFSVMINGKIETDIETIYQKLSKNYDVMHDIKIDINERKSMCSDIKVVKDENGKKSTDIIKDIMTVSRQHQPEIKHEGGSFKKTHKVSKGDAKAVKKAAQKLVKEGKIAKKQAGELAREVKKLLAEGKITRADIRKALLNGGELPKAA